MVEQNFLTLEEGCNKYLDNCRARNLREGTINHYRQSYVQFYKYFGKDLLVKDIDEKVYQKYVIFLRETLHNDVSINAYLRDFITTMHFLMREGYVAPFRMQAIKVDRSGVETYTEEELYVLLKKPNIKKCSFTEHQCWVMTNFLFSTVVRLRSLMHIRVKDIDFDNNVVHVTVTTDRQTEKGHRPFSRKSERKVCTVPLCRYSEFLFYDKWIFVKESRFFHREGNFSKKKKGEPESLSTGLARPYRLVRREIKDFAIQLVTENSGAISSTRVIAFVPRSIRDFPIFFSSNAVSSLPSASK